MHLTPALAALRQRFRRPAIWALVLLVPGFLGSLLVFFSPAQRALGSALLLWLIVALWWGFGVFLAPLPWQWHQPSGGPPSLGRGLLQSLIQIGLGAFLVSLLAELGRGAFGHGFQLHHWEMGWLVFTVLSLPMGLLGFGLARAERLAAEVRAAEAEARFLEWTGQQGGFPPQLLFETLDALGDKATLEAARVERGLLELAALYRQWLIQGQVPITPLDRERELVNCYLAIEQRRMGPQLRQTVSWPDEMNSRPVPSMLLLGVVQWCLEVGRESRGAVDFQMEARTSNGGLQVDLRCSGNPSLAATQTLVRLRARLEARDEGGSLLLSPEASQFRVSLRIDLLGGSPDPETVPPDAFQEGRHALV